MKLDWSSYIVSIAKTTSKKIGALTRSPKFLSPEVALYLCKSNIRSFMEYYYYVWSGAGYVKSEKRVCETVSATLAASSSQYCQLKPFYGYYFGRCSSEPAQLVLFSSSCKRATLYSDRLHDFYVTIPRRYVYVNSSFHHTAKLWNSLPAEYFPMTYDLNSFKSRVNRQTRFDFRFFLNSFLVYF